MTEAVLFDAAIGLGALAYLVFLLGLVGLLRFPIFIGLLVVISLIVWIPLVKLAGEIIPGIRAHFSSRPSILEALTGVVLAAIGGMALINALAPPIAADWDGLAYHLAVPKLYLEQGRIFYIPFSSHSNFPFTVEMLYTLGLGLGSISLAKLFHLVFGVLAAAAVYVTARRHFGSRPALYSVLLVAGMPIVAWEATVAYVDLALVLYTVLPASAILAYSDTRDTKWLVLAALTAGLAAGTKMTGLAAIAVFAFWIGLEVWSSRKGVGESAGKDETGSMRLDPRVTLKQMMMFTLIALAVASPWYIKSFVHTGNPVYPFFYDIFGGRNWSAEIAEEYRRLQSQFGIGHSAADFIRAPWDLVFRSDRFYDRPGLHIGPAFLAILPLVVLAALRSRSLSKIWAVSLAFFIIWFLMTQQSRYLLPVLGIMAVGAGGVLATLPRLRVARFAAYCAAFTGAALSIFILACMCAETGRVVLGFERQDAYLARKLDTYRAVDYINKNTPEESKVILYGDTRGFYLERDYLWGDPGHNALIPYAETPNAEGLVEFLSKLGVTHALLNDRYFGADGQHVRLVRAAVHAGLLEQIYRDEQYPVAVYVLRNSP